MNRGPDGRFPKNHSGNPKGRPRKPKQSPAGSSDLLNKRFSVEIDGVQRELTAEEALQIRTYNAAVGGNRQAMREVVRMIKMRDAHLEKHGVNPAPVPTQVTKFSFDSDNVDKALVLLGMARWQPMFDFPCGSDRQILKLQNWVAQTAMARRNAPELNEDDLILLRNATRDPSQVRWR